MTAIADTDVALGQLWALITSAIPARAVQVAAELAVADLIDETPVRVPDLARSCGASPEALDRTLKLLSDIGLFAHRPEGYVHTDASRLLRTDHPTSLRAFARLMGLPLMWGGVGALNSSVKTGVPGTASFATEGLFDYLAAHSDQAEVFNDAMAAKARADVAAILNTYDFSPFPTIADIGGGRGHLVRAIVARHRTSRGILFDLPHVITNVTIDDEHLTTWAGDFFTDPLPAADLYLVMEVLHDWPDREATAILRGIRAACTPGAVLLVVESLPADDKPDPRARTLDLIMLAVTGGHERTPGSLERLLTATGFRLTAVLDTGGPLRVAEAIAI